MSEAGEFEGTIFRTTDINDTIRTGISCNNRRPVKRSGATSSRGIWRYDGGKSIVNVFDLKIPKRTRLGKVDGRSLSDDQCRCALIGIRCDLTFDTKHSRVAIHIRRERIGFDADHDIISDGIRYGPRVSLVIDKSIAAIYRP